MLSCGPCVQGPVCSALAGNEVRRTEPGGWQEDWKPSIIGETHSDSARWGPCSYILSFQYFTTDGELQILPNYAVEDRPLATYQITQIEPLTQTN